MQASYSKNYLKIYIWQGLSLVLNFLSMFVVVPYLSSNPPVYGIYSICISFSIFLSYADLGFLSAGQKFASEAFARGDKEEEVHIIGFTNFILLLFLILFSLVFILFSRYPGWLIKDLIQPDQIHVASMLLLILAIFTPVTLLQRLLQMIYGVRLEDFIVQRTNIMANVLKIASVLYFMRNGNYDIVGYFLFTQLVNLGAALITLYLAKVRYAYPFAKLIKSFHFNKKIFAKTKALALTSLYSAITWILYYELDSAAIGKMLGPQQVAIFTIGLTILSFFRSILGTLFSPFNVRFNHFVGLKDQDGLKAFYSGITRLTLPMVIFPIMAIFLLAEPLILTWVGEEYRNAILPAQILVLCNLFAFISYPTSLLLMAQEKIRMMIVVNTLLPVIYWTGIFATYHWIGIHAFAVFKLLSFLINAAVFFVILAGYLKLSFGDIMSRYLKPVVVPILLMLVLVWIGRDFMPIVKSKFNLLQVGGAIGILVIVAGAATLMMHTYYRDQVRKVIVSFKG